MSSDQLTIAGRSVPCEAAVDVVLNYEPETVRLYDLGGVSPPDQVTLEDLGRMVCIAAELNYSDARALMALGPSAPWIEPGHSLVDAEPGSDLFRRAAALYEHFTAARGIKHAKASKLLHLKHPHLIPILDSEVVTMYGGLARDAAIEELGPTGRNQRRWWQVIREDLISNADALAEVRQLVHASGDERSAEVLRLSDLRFMDIVTWKLARQQRLS